MKRSAFFFATLALMTTTVWSQDKCPAQFAQDGEEWCDARKAEYELKQVDAELNGAYQKMLKGVNSDQRKRIVGAQKKWLDWSKADCSAYVTVAAPAANSVLHTAHVSCLTAKTRARTKDFEIFLKK